MIRKVFSIVVLVSFVVVLAATAAFSAPAVSYTIGGSTGNWILDFTITNTLGVDNMDIYFFGVALDPVNQGFPTSNWSAYDNYNTANHGGPDMTFATGWLNFGVNIPDMIQNGETMSGFTVTAATADAPTSLQWYAFANAWAASAFYNGNDNFNNSVNPGFVGIASASVPEPATLLLFGGGLAGLFAGRRIWKR